MYTVDSQFKELNLLNMSMGQRHYINCEKNKYLKLIFILNLYIYLKDYILEWVYNRGTSLTSYNNIYLYKICIKINNYNHIITVFGCQGKTVKI